VSWIQLSMIILAANISSRPTCSSKCRSRIKWNWSFLRTFSMLKSLVPLVTKLFKNKSITAPQYEILKTWTLVPYYFHINSNKVLQISTPTVAILMWEAHLWHEKVFHFAVSVTANFLPLWPKKITAKIDQIHLSKVQKHTAQNIELRDWFGTTSKIPQCCIILRQPSSDVDVLHKFTFSKYRRSKLDPTLRLVTV